jgi:formate dehydrogenase beta subunit
VIDEEVGYILGLGVEFRGGQRIDSMKALLAEGLGRRVRGQRRAARAAICPSCRAGRKPLPDPPGHRLAGSVSFGHVNEDRQTCAGARRRKYGHGLLPLRRGGWAPTSVKVMVRSGYEDMKASPWEKEDAQHEGIPIMQLPCAAGLRAAPGRPGHRRCASRSCEPVFDANGQAPPGAHRRARCRGATATRCWWRWARRTPFRGSSATAASRSTTMGPCRCWTRKTYQSTTLPRVFFGGDAAFGPKNIITAVAQGPRGGGVSIDRFLHGEDVDQRPPPHVNLMSQKMGIHQWSYHNAPGRTTRVSRCRGRRAEAALKSIRVEVELGFDLKAAFKEAQRCLNCDVQTVFAPKLCIECDACVDICPTDCLTLAAPVATETELRTALTAPAANAEQALYVSEPLKTRALDGQGRGRLPALRAVRRALPDRGPWDMQKFLLTTAQAGAACRGALA